MKKVLVLSLLIIVLMTPHYFFSMLGTQELKDLIEVGEMLQTAQKHNLVIIEPSKMFLVAGFSAICAGVNWISSWKSTVDGAVSAGSVGLELYAKKVESDLAVNKKILETSDEAKEALEVLSGMDLTQVQLLAITEANTNSSNTYWRDRHAQLKKEAEEQVLTVRNT